MARIGSGGLLARPPRITLAGVPSFLNDIDKLPGRGCGGFSSRDGLLSLARTLLPPSPGRAAPALRPALSQPGVRDCR